MKVCSASECMDARFPPSSLHFPSATSGYSPVSKSLKHFRSKEIHSGGQLGPGMTVVDWVEITPSIVMR